MCKPGEEEVQLGPAGVVGVFRSSKFGPVAGALVRSGEIKRGTRARILRGGAVVGGGIEITGLRRFKDDISEVKQGFECGIGLEKYQDVKVGDIIEAYQVEKVAGVMNG